jgi:hypothetical protein
MAFGISGNDKKSQMIGGDVTVAWMDHPTGLSVKTVRLFKLFVCSNCSSVQIVLLFKLFGFLIGCLFDCKSVYIFCIICLAVGISVGLFFRSIVWLCDNIIFCIPTNYVCLSVPISMPFTIFFYLSFSL